MHLTPHEQERLMIHVAADVVDKRLRRNPDLPLNYAEVMAVLTSYILEEARHGQKTVAAVMAEGKTLLEDVWVMRGVPEMIEHVQVEATFPDGTKLVTLRDLSFKKVVPGVAPLVPGKVEHFTGDGDKVRHNEHLERQVTSLKVRNDDTRKRPVQVGSHYHFYEANPALTFLDAETEERLGRDDPDNGALGMRLNVPAGSSVRFEPDDLVEVQLVPIEGGRVVPGLRGDTEPLPVLSPAAGGQTGA